MLASDSLVCGIPPSVMLLLDTLVLLHSILVVEGAVLSHWESRQLYVRLKTAFSSPTFYCGTEEARKPTRMSFVIKQTTLPVISKTLGQASVTRFPVNRVYCIGRNYRDHALEMGHDPGKTSQSN